MLKLLWFLIFLFCIVGWIERVVSCQIGQSSVSGLDILKYSTMRESLDPRRDTWISGHPHLPYPRIPVSPRNVTIGSDPTITGWVQVYAGFNLWRSWRPWFTSCRMILKCRANNHRAGDPRLLNPISIRISVTSEWKGCVTVDSVIVDFSG